MYVYLCNECGGEGTVIWTKERGGPKCNGCNGVGYLTQELLCREIGGMLDYPSCYMGGPSRNSLKRAADIIEILKRWGIELPHEPAREEPQ